MVQTVNYCFEDNDVGVEGAMHLGRLLAENRTLTMLNLKSKFNNLDYVVVTWMYTNQILVSEMKAQLISLKD